MPEIHDVETPHGPARVHLHRVDAATGALVLGHGAGGGVQAGDIQAASEVAREQGLSVALVEQPYRVAGRRSPAPAKQLDAAWTVVLDHLRANELDGVPLIVGGRSLGARVACRTVEQTGGRAVLCLAFPLHPPGRPENSRLGELEAVTVPVLIVQGDRDPFGMPPAAGRREVALVPGNHSLRTDLDAVRRVVADWISRVL